ncbi:MAG: hypothetical protein H7841_12070 [Magnetospirillum sp. WYHS-4]
MKNARRLAETIRDKMTGCPRQGECLARKFVEKRLLTSLDDADTGGIWHWTTHSVGEIDQCDLPCPGKDPMAELVETLHRALK